MTGPYRERAHLTALLAAIYPSSMQADLAEPGWMVCMIELPTGQCGWHISAEDMDLFTHVPHILGNTYDGHTTEEKYARVDALAEQLSEADAQTLIQLNWTDGHAVNVQRHRPLTDDEARELLNDPRM